MSDQPNRREFIQRASLLSLGAAGLGNLPARGAESAPSVGGHPLKISLGIYSFNQALTAPAAGGAPAMTVFDVLDYAAQNNFDALDATGYYFPGYPRVPADSFIYDLKRRAFKLGLGISGTGIRTNFAQPDPAKRAAEVQLTKDWIEVASKLGVSSLRVFAGAAPAGQAWDEAAGWVAEALKPCVEYGRQHGIMLGIQNHTDLLQTGDQVLKIVKLVDSEWFGVIVDTGNFHGPDPYDDIARVAPHAINFQIKESPFGAASPVRMDMKKLLPIIHGVGYRGYLPIETLAAPGQAYDPRVAVPILLQQVRQALATGA